MIDPTWGATTGGVDYFETLDFDHFAFVVKGKMIAPLFLQVDTNLIKTET